MTDQASDCLTNDHRTGAQCERGTTGTAWDVGCHLSSLPDPCSSAQLAAVLGKSPKTLVDWCQEREYTTIPCFRLGNRWYHRVPELIRWLNGIRSGQIEFHRRPRESRSVAARQRTSKATTRRDE